MAKEIFFFVTIKDILSILEKIQMNERLIYIKTGVYVSKNFVEYELLNEYEDLGINKSGNHQSESFLVMKNTNQLVVREVEQMDGSIRYFIDQYKNEDSITLWPGGVYDNKYLICGHLGTIHKTEQSNQLFSLFKNNIMKQCKTRVGKYYIGEDAEKLYGNMRFITININQASEYDLKL